MNPLDVLVEALKPLTAEQGLASLTILMLTILMNLFVMVINKIVMDPELQRRYMKEFTEYRHLMNEYKMKGNKKILVKIRKKEPIVMNLSKRVFMRSIVRMVIVLLLAWLIFAVMGTLFDPAFTVLIPFPVETPVNWFIWYFICIFASSFPMSRIFGISISMMPRSPEVSSREEKPSVKAKD